MPGRAPPLDGSWAAFGEDDEEQGHGDLRSGGGARGVRPGSTLCHQQQVQTTLVPSGGAAIAELTVNLPGTYLLVDHSLVRAFDKGAIGTLVVEGEDDEALYSGKQQDNTYGGSLGPPPIPAGADPMVHGKQVFEATCALCHQVDANEVQGVFPPLAGSEYVDGDKPRLIGIPIHGLSGKIEVLGKEYNGVMPSLASLSDEELAHALTYVRASFGNHGDAVTPEEVAAVRAEPAPAPTAAP